MRGKLLIDNGKGAFNAAVGLLNADVEGVGGDGGAVGEGHHLPVDKNASASHLQGVPIGKDRFHHALLGQNGAVGVFLFEPRCRESAALVEEFGRKRAVLKIGVLGAEAVRVVAFGLIGAALKRGKATAAVDIVVLVADGFRFDYQVGMLTFNGLHLRVFKAEQHKAAAAVGKKVAQQFRLKVARSADHIGPLAIEGEAQHHGVGQHADFGLKPKLPAHKVGKVVVAVAPPSLERHGLHRRTVRN